APPRPHTPRPPPPPPRRPPPPPPPRAAPAKPARAGPPGRPAPCRRVPRGEARSAENSPPHEGSGRERDDHGPDLRKLSSDRPRAPSRDQPLRFNSPRWFAETPPPTAGERLNRGLGITLGPLVSPIRARRGCP